MDESTVAIRKPVSSETLAAISPLPPPEEIFIDWLLSVPHGTDIEKAARRQIALLDRRTPLHPYAQCLRALFVAIAGESHWHKPVQNL